MRGRFLTIAVLLTGLLTMSARAGAPAPDLTDTDWDTSGRASYRVQRVGGGPGAMSGYLSMGDGDFHLALRDPSATVDVYGTWTTDRKGRPLFLPDAAALASELEGIFDRYIDEYFSMAFDMYVDDWWITVHGIGVKAVPKVRGSTVTIALKVKMSFSMIATTGSRTESIRSSVSYGGKGSPD